MEATNLKVVHDIEAASRRKILILPRVQLYMTAYTLVLSAVYFFSILLAGKFSMNKLRGAEAAKNLPADHLFFKFLDSQESMMFESLLMATGICIVVTFFASLLVSRKFVGPIIGLRNRFREMNVKGEIEPLPFRKGDYLIDTVQEFNELVERKLAKSGNTQAK